MELCDPFRPAISDLPSEEGWHTISRLANLHGVSPFFFYRTRSLEISLPHEIKKRWLESHLLQIAREERARYQIKELAGTLGSEGVRFILLKGASAILRLYPETGLRSFYDLDIMIREESVSQFKRAMMKLGYKPSATLTSPEDEDLQRFEGHLDPLRKEDGLMIEAHVSILGRKGNYRVSLSEIWQGREKTDQGEMSVEHLGKEHFLIHMFLHWRKDLIYNGFVSIKGLVDVLYALKTWRIDWTKWMDAVRRWNVEKEIIPVVATMNHHWQAAIPLPGEAKPLGLGTLLSGAGTRGKNGYSRVPGDPIERLLLVRQLPDAASRIRYVFHLVLPPQENLRRRFNLPPTRSAVPYYLPYILVTSGRLATGLWHRFRHRGEYEIF